MSRFRQLRTPRLDRLSGDELARAAETVRREHELAIEELRRRVRALEEAPRLVGIAVMQLSASQTGLASGTTIAFDDERLNTTGGLVTVRDGRFRLTAGYSYRLTANATLTTGGSDTINLSWYDVRGAQYVGTQASVYDPGATGSTSAQPVAHFAAKLTASGEYEARAFLAVGSPNASNSYSYAVAEVYQ